MFQKRSIRRDDTNPSPGIRNLPAMGTYSVLPPGVSSLGFSAAQRFPCHQHYYTRGSDRHRFSNAINNVVQQVLIGVGDMAGPPGCDPSDCSATSVAVDLAPQDTVWDVKKRLIAEAGWRDELPSDFGLFNDVSEEPLMDGQSIDSALAPNKPSSAKKAVSRRGGGRATAAAASIRLPRPYVGVLWAARLG